MIPVAITRFVTLSLALALRVLPAQAEGHGVLRVGVILPLSGDAASVGAATRNGMELARSGLPPEDRVRLRLAYEDDQLSPAKTVTAYRKLRDAGAADVVVNIFSGTAKAIAPVVERDRVPLIAIASDPAVVASRRYIVNLWVTPEVEAEVALSEALRRGYRRIARIVSIQDGMLAIRATFDAANAGRIELALDEEYPPDVKDFRPFIAKLRLRSDVDAVGIMLLPGQCGTFAKQVREAGIGVPLFGFEVFEDANEVKVKEFRGALGTYSASGDNLFTLPAAVKEVTATGFRRLGPSPSLLGNPNR